MSLDALAQLFADEEGVKLTPEDLAYVAHLKEVDKKITAHFEEFDETYAEAARRAISTNVVSSSQRALPNPENERNAA